MTTEQLLIEIVRRLAKYRYDKNPVKAGAFDGLVQLVEQHHPALLKGEAFWEDLERDE